MTASAGRDTDVERPTDVVLSLPPDWVVLPVGPPASLDIDALVRAAPADIRREFEALLTDAVLAISEAPVVFAAMYALFEEGVGLQLLIVMSVLIEEFPSELVDVDGLMAAVADGHARLVDPERVELPLGATLRGHRITDDAGEGESGAEFSTLYFTPIAARDQLSIVSFSSPQVSLRAELTPLFDDIARTVRFRWARIPGATSVED